MSTAERDLFRLLGQSRQRHRTKDRPRRAQRHQRREFQSGRGQWRCRLSSREAKGSGKKTAERIIVELKDKVGVAAAWEAASAAHAPSPEETQINDAVLALISLGYKQIDAHKAVKERSEKGPGQGAEELVRAGAQTADMSSRAATSHCRPRWARGAVKRRGDLPALARSPFRSSIPFAW